MILELSGYHLKMPGNRANSVQAHLFGLVSRQRKESRVFAGFGLYLRLRGKLVGLQAGQQTSPCD